VCVRSGLLTRRTHALTQNANAQMARLVETALTHHQNQLSQSLASLGRELDTTKTDVCVRSDALAHKMDNAGERASRWNKVCARVFVFLCLPLRCASRGRVSERARDAERVRETARPARSLSHSLFSFSLSLSSRSRTHSLRSKKKRRLRAAHRLRRTSKCALHRSPTLCRRSPSTRLL
jgi:hypothetical protein